VARQQKAFFWSAGKSCRHRRGEKHLEDALRERALNEAVAYAIRIDVAEEPCFRAPI
jgi:hypothetical protein